jgi:hypothetical protein
MKPLPWEALRAPSAPVITYTVTADVTAQLRALRAERAAREWLTDDDGKMTAKLSAVAEAVVTFIGLEAVSKRIQTVAVSEDKLTGYSAPEPTKTAEFRIPVFDIHGLIERHRESTTRLDELTRLKARDEYEASKRATKNDGAAIRVGQSVPAVLYAVAPAKPAPVAAVAGTSKVWTTERLAELRDYRAEHGTKLTGEHFGISGARVRKLQPGDKPQPKGYSVFSSPKR